jgi:nitrate/nitrite-specific signal transduction histidine kinase
MKVKNRLHIKAAISIIAAFVILFMVFLAGQSINRAMKAAEMADQVIAYTFERGAARIDYLRNGNKESRVQWFLKNDQIQRLLKSQSERIVNVEDKANIEKLIETNKSIRMIFKSIVANRQAAGLNRHIEDSLVTQLDMRTHEAVLSVPRVQKSGRRVLYSTLRSAALGILCMVVALICAAIINSRSMSRTIGRRVKILQRGATIIGRGNFNYSIKINGDDEFTELARAFDIMTAKLRESYANLEAENMVRKSAEERLSLKVNELAYANRELEAFSYSIAHDLRNPLNNILTLIEVLNQEAGFQINKDSCILCQHRVIIMLLKSCALSLMKQKQFIQELI